MPKNSPEQIIDRPHDAGLRRGGTGTSTSSGATTFTALTDAPHSYAGEAGAVLVAKADATGLEFGAVATATPTADAIPIAAATGLIANGWLDATLASLAALGTVADRIAYTTALDVWAEATLTSFARTLLGDADQAAVQATLALVPGTNVQAYDATLLSIAALGTAADKMLYTTALDTWAEAAITGYGRTLVALADATALRANINVADGADVTGAAITALATKTTPVDADAVVITDSAASDAPKRTLWSNIKAVLKTYFDTLYGLLGTANTWTKNNTIASTTTSGNALRVVRDLASGSTDDAVAEIVQDNVGDDQPALVVQQDGTGNIFELYDGATLVMQMADGGTVTYPLGFVNYGNDTATGPSMGLNGAAGVVRQMGFRTAGLLRWVLRADSVAEAGSNVGSNLEILRRTDAGGALETVMHLQRATGRIGIGGITAPAGRMDISQGGSAAAPVLVLRQADVSEELIEVVSTAGAGNTVDTAALGAYAGKIRITVNGTYYYVPYYS